MLAPAAKRLDGASAAARAAVRRTSTHRLETLCGLTQCFTGTFTHRLHSLCCVPLGSDVGCAVRPPAPPPGKNIGPILAARTGKLACAASPAAPARGVLLAWPQLVLDSWCLAVSPARQALLRLLPSAALLRRRETAIMIWVWDWIRGSSVRLTRTRDSRRESNSKLQYSI
jgi:hypothetical protein